MVILYDAIEHTEGHPGKGSLFPWNVLLTKEASGLMGRTYITKAKDLHAAAKQWQAHQEYDEFARGETLRNRAMTSLDRMSESMEVDDA